MEQTIYIIEFSVSRLTLKDGNAVKSTRLANISGPYDEAKRKSIEIALDTLEVK